MKWFRDPHFWDATKEFLKMLIFFLFYEFGEIVLIDKFAHAFSTYLPYENIYALTYALFSCLWAVILYHCMVLFVERRPLKHTIFAHSTKLACFMPGAGMGASLAAISIVLSIVAGAVVFFSQGVNVKSSMMVAGAQVLAILFAAVGEEIVLRGYMLGALMRSYVPAPLAVVFTAFLFSGMHRGHFEVHNIAIFIAGLLLGYEYLHGGCVYPCIGLHFAFRCVEALAFSYVFFAHVIVKPFWAGARWLSPHAQGMIGLLVLLFGLVIFVMRNKLWKVPKEEPVHK